MAMFLDKLLIYSTLNKVFKIDPAPLMGRLISFKHPPRMSREYVPHLMQRERNQIEMAFKTLKVANNLDVTWIY